MKIDFCAINRRLKASIVVILLYKVYIQKRSKITLDVTSVHVQSLVAFEHQKCGKLK